MTDTLSAYAARVDRATPADRDRFVDLLRGVGILAVVGGHWLTAHIYEDADGRLDVLNVLGVADWTHWLTWLFQVMPVFFLVGGHANATSWERHASKGGSWAAWVHRRSARLLRPTALFAGVIVSSVIIANVAGADPVLVDRAGWGSGIVLWFLAVYVAVAALTPLTHRLHRRFGVAATGTLAVLVAVGDIARIVTGEPAWATANMVLGWALIHQVGYWWRDGQLPSRPAHGLLLALGGAVALVGLTMLGPWPVAMVNVPGDVIHNSSPPSLALLALFAVQTGVALAVAGRAREWLRRPIAWTVVATVNMAVLTLFLWHMVAVVLGAVLLYGTGALPEAEPLTAEWFAWRPVWLGALTVIAAALVAVFVTVEQRTTRPARLRRERPVLGSALAGVGVPLACAGFLGLTIGGLAGDGPLGIPLVGLTTFAAGVVMTNLAGWFVRQPQ